MVKILEYPSEKDWMEVKRRALITVGLSPVNPPDSVWKHDILEARHSPIRRLHYSFYLEIPYWVSLLPQYRSEAVLFHIAGVGLLLHQEGP